MSRVLKFRVWDKENKCFLTAPKEYNNLAFVLKDEEQTGCVPLNYFCAFLERYIVQQYIELEDKNGKEIFEGDILRIYLSRDNPNSVYEDYEIIFDSKKAGFVGVLTRKPNFIEKPEIELSFYRHDCYEVIGNVEDKSVKQV